MLNKFVDNTKKIFKECYIKFPLTNICIFIIVVCMMIGSKYNFINDILMLVGFFSLGCYCIETKNSNRLCYPISFLVSFMFWFFLKQDSNTEFFEFISKLSITYIFVVIIYTIYNNYKNSNKEFSQYLENILREYIKLSFVYGVLALSIYMIISIFNNLVIDIIDNDLISDIEIFLCGMYYVSNMLNVLKGESNNDGVFFKLLVRKILNPLLYVSVIIIYLFIIRLFIDGEINEDYVFYIVSYLFLFGVPLILICTSYKENDLLDRINKYSSYLLIPFVLLQFYLLFNKVNLYGITDVSYIWILVIIFELFYLIYSFMNVDYGNLFIVLMILIVITNIVPFINLDDLVLYSQRKNLELYKNKSTYTEVEKKRIYNSYDYLYYVDYEYIKKLGITSDDERVIMTFNEDYEDFYYDEVYEYDYLDARYNGIIDISGYDKLYNINVYSYDLEVNYIEKLNIKYDDYYVEFEFKDMSLNYYNNIDNISSYFKDNNIIFLDDKYKLVLTNIDIDYEDGVITRYNIYGYLLVKDDKKLDENIVIE